MRNCSVCRKECKNSMCADCRISASRARRRELVLDRVREGDHEELRAVGGFVHTSARFVGM